jgi:hypothetical protein
MAVSRWSKIQLQPNLLISLFSGLNFKLYIYILCNPICFFFFYETSGDIFKGKINLSIYGLVFFF